MAANKLSLIAASIVLALGLAACNKTPDTASTDGDGTTVGSKIDEGTDKLGAKTDSAEESMDDAGITTKVKTAILNDPELKVLQIHVATNNGVVTLTGTVDSPANSDHAKNVAGAVKGVKSVDNQLTVKTAG